METNDYPDEGCYDCLVDFSNSPITETVKILLHL